MSPVSVKVYVEYPPGPPNDPSLYIWTFRGPFWAMILRFFPTFFVGPLRRVRPRGGMGRQAAADGSSRAGGFPGGRGPPQTDLGCLGRFLCDNGGSRWGDLAGGPSHSRDAMRTERGRDMTQTDKRTAAISELWPVGSPVVFGEAPECRAPKDAWPRRPYDLEPDARSFRPVSLPLAIRHDSARSRTRIQPRSGRNTMLRDSAALVLAAALSSCSGVRELQIAEAPGPADHPELRDLMKTLTYVYGAPGQSSSEFDMLLVELNGDSKPETLLLIQPNHLGPSSELLRGRSVKAKGFVLLCDVYGKPWPVVYYYNDYEDVFRIANLDGTLQIIATKERAGGHFEQTRWYCRERDPWRRGRWVAQRRYKNGGSDYGQWRDFSPFFAICAK